MKKPYIYALIAAALVIIGALAAVYQINNPGIMIPSKTYTETNVSKLDDYRYIADQLGIDEKFRGSTVYAAAIEESRTDIGMSVYDYIDITGERYTILSNGVQTEPKKLSEDEVKELFENLSALYGSDFVLTENTDYRVPDRDHVKVYIRRGDGVYYRLYDKKEMPDVVKQYLDGREFK